MSDITAQFEAMDADFKAFYMSDRFEVGTTGEPEDQRQVAFVLKIDDVSDYEDFERKTAISVLVVPTTLTDRAFNELESSMGHEWVKRDDPESIVRACESYGMYAHANDFAMGITFAGPEKSFKQVCEDDDYDEISEWIEAHGETIVSACAGMIGFALDRQQNRIGETGWDWIMPYMYDDYESETAVLRR